MDENNNIVPNNSANTIIKLFNLCQALQQLIQIFNFLILQNEAISHHKIPILMGTINVPSLNHLHQRIKRPLHIVPRRLYFTLLKFTSQV